MEETFQGQRYLALINRLRRAGAKIDGIGLQWHLFSDRELSAMLAGELHAPADMLRALDDYHRLGLPVHISEITLPATDASPEAQAMQAELARAVYRLWFSHPAVHAITWWNVPDGGGAAGGENRLASGLLNQDLTPKPAYEALRQLIRHEWRTSLRLTSDNGGALRFRGFRGEYRLLGDGWQQAFRLTEHTELTLTSPTGDGAR